MAADAVSEVCNRTRASEDSARRRPSLVSGEGRNRTGDTTIFSQSNSTLEPG